MTRHLLKIVWNRRRSNTLIALEILLSFLVLVAVVTMGVYLVNNYRQPLGFVYDDVWAVRVSMNVPEEPGVELTPEQTPAGRRARLQTLLQLVRDMPDVLSASVVNDAPYSHSAWISGIDVGGRSFSYWANRAGDTFADTMRLTITRGRWFNASDDGAAWEPVVVNERMARKMFGGEDPVGRTIKPDPPKNADGGPPQASMRIVGVIADFRKDGEFSPLVDWVFYRSTLGAAATGPGVPRNLVVRARPGATAAFEANLVDLLNRNAPDLSFRARPLSLARSTVLREKVPMLAASGLVAVFLLTMVMLGLTGVLWLTVTQRTREVGLRRAKGATARDIQRQLRGEVAVLTSIAVAIGTLVVFQFPVLKLFTNVVWQVYAVGVAISMLCIYALAIACAWAPSRLASSIEPAEALRWE
jgi:putative ABC transport system permease protein